MDGNRVMVAFFIYSELFPSSIPHNMAVDTQRQHFGY